jgi:hypothetical protein
MNDIVIILNNYFLSEFKSFVSETKKLFICTIDNSNCNKGSYGFRKFLKDLVGSFIFNIIEFLKSKIRGRNPVYKKLKFYLLCFDDITHINFNNGTAVVLRDTCVYKFYFKDIMFFSNLYNRIAKFVDCETYFCESFFLIKQPRYNHLVCCTKDLGFLISLKNYLDSFEAFCEVSIENKESFSPRQKVRQIFEFYKQSKNKNIVDYLDLAQLLEAKVEPFKKVLCHGDLWSENILCRNNGEVFLIDFDKAVTYIDIYDIIYLFIMMEVLPRRIPLEQLLISIEYFSNIIEKYLIVDCKRIFGQPTNYQIKLCIYLFAFLKIVERDMRHKKTGGSIGILKKLMDTL